MLSLYSGPFAELEPAHRDAANGLVWRRYLKDIVHLDESLKCQGWAPGTPIYKKELASRSEGAKAELNRFSESTDICAVFLETSHRPVALGTMRTVRGHRTDVWLTQSIGDARSSLPTHTLFKNFAYPTQPDFEAAKVAESHMLECSRLAIIDRDDAKGLIAAGMMAKADLLAMLPDLFDELIVHSYRRAMPRPGTQHWAGCLFNVKPRLAQTLRAKKDLGLLPLFADGVELADETLAPGGLFERYFAKWTPELSRPPRGGPPRIGNESTTCVAQPALLECDISLPYLIVCNAELECAILALETKLDQAAYSIERHVRQDV